MNRKLSDQQVEEIRQLYASGSSLSELSAAYDVSERHCRRLVDGVEQVELSEPGNVEVAVQRFIATVKERLEPDPRTEVVAASALQVAKKLDRSDARSAAGLAARLVELIDDLRWRTREPDALDALQQRRLERLRQTTG